LKYEKTIAPKHAACAAKTGLTFIVANMGAVMEAEVIIATVPLPWTSLTKVATKNGKSMAGRPVPAMSFAT